jgi:predicted Rdx family selenoprotein
LNDSGITTSIAEGENSQFDVLSNGKLVFSKQREGRFPEEDEILALLAARRP